MKRLSLSLLVFLLSATSAYATPSQDAVNAAARAFYQYEHWNDDVNNLLKHYENKFTPRQKEIGGAIYQIIKVISDHQIQVTWHFP